MGGFQWTAVLLMACFGGAFPARADQMSSKELSKRVTRASEFKRNQSAIHIGGRAFRATSVEEDDDEKAILLASSTGSKLGSPRTCDSSSGVNCVALVG